MPRPRDLLAGYCSAGRSYLLPQEYLGLYAGQTTMKLTFFDMNPKPKRRSIWRLWLEAALLLVLLFLPLALAKWYPTLPLSISLQEWVCRDLGLILSVSYAGYAAFIVWLFRQACR